MVINVFKQFEKREGRVQNGSQNFMKYVLKSESGTNRGDMAGPRFIRSTYL